MACSKPGQFGDIDVTQAAVILQHGLNITGCHIHVIPARQHVLSCTVVHDMQGCVLCFVLLP